MIFSEDLPTDIPNILLNIKSLTSFSKSSRFWNNSFSDIVFSNRFPEGEIISSYTLSIVFSEYDNCSFSVSSNFSNSLYLSIKTGLNSSTYLAISDLKMNDSELSIISIISLTKLVVPIIFIRLFLIARNFTISSTSCCFTSSSLGVKISVIYSSVPFFIFLANNNSSSVIIPCDNNSLEVPLYSDISL